MLFLVLATLAHHVIGIGGSLHSLDWGKRILQQVINSQDR